MYDKNQLRQIFQSRFDLETWNTVLRNIVRADELRTTPETITDPADCDHGYYLGAKNTADSYRIGLFLYEVQNSSVARKCVGLRNLVKTFINPRWGQFDAALAVFTDGQQWRLSFISDIRGEATSPKRYTFVFGEADNLYRTAIERFQMLQDKGVTFETLKEAFSVEALTKQFYNDLFEWYQWAVSPESNVTFPNDTTTEDDDRENIDTKIIRLITRIMFVWFIKQKGLVPNKIFNENHLKDILKDFDPQSDTSGNYYNAILQNLFFATLNRAIEDEQGNKRRFSTLKGHRDIKNLYRYAELFSISEAEVIRMFSNVPFLNGGLFECQDKTVRLNGVEKAYNYDGFSRNDARFADGRYKYRAMIPNALFFKPEYGLFDILNRYNFTIEENSPNEQQVALDPELLGKVFENLLGAYNPETKETARNQSGSFYTPREIVNYMVDESLKAYLGDSEIVSSLFSDNFQKDEALTDEYNALAEKIKAIKILDPACGSGAFPMGLLNRMVDILQKISPEENVYNLKLSIIENCIYGSDIQSIAAQISKLRFFISLICDCTPDKSKPNFGIPTLPNLETKFVCANSLIGLKKNEGGLVNLFIEEKKQELQEVRHQHFNARTANQKAKLREKDEQLRKELAEMLEEDAYFASEESKQIVAWNPYDQNACSPFFDPEWMFGVKKFDIVIGNPPYLRIQGIRNSNSDFADYLSGNFSSATGSFDLYVAFVEKSLQLISFNGIVNFIMPVKWTNAAFGKGLREVVSKQKAAKKIINFSEYQVFNASTYTGIHWFKPNSDCLEYYELDRNLESNTELKNYLDNLSTDTVSIVRADKLNKDTWVLTSSEISTLLNKLNEQPLRLEDIFEKIFQGIATSKDDVYFIYNCTETQSTITGESKQLNKRITIEKGLVKPLLKGEDVHRYDNLSSDRYVIFPYKLENGTANLYSEEEIKTLFPYGYAYLKECESVLRGREKGRLKDDNYWYRYIYPKNLTLFQSPKLVAPEISLGGNFSYDKNGQFYSTTTIYGYIKKESCEVSYETLMAILNSKLCWWFMSNTGTVLAQGYYRYKPAYIKPFPIPQIPNEVDSEIKSLVAELERPDAKDRQMVERKIDIAIYNLYGINGDDIELINKTC